MPNEIENVVSGRRTARWSGQDGFTLLDMLFVVGLLGMLSALALPHLVRAKVAAHSVSALGTLRTIHSAQLSFAISCGQGFFAPDLPTLGVPPVGYTDTFLPSDLVAATSITRSGYTISLVGTALTGSPQTCNGLGGGVTAASYVIVADPVDPVANPRFFATNADGVIYEDSTTFAGTMPEAGAPPSGMPLSR